MSPLILTLFILITGGVTSYTDLKSRMIKNHHLFVIGLVYFVIYITTFSFPKAYFKEHLLSLLIAMLISSFMCLRNQWRPGDAKLFILYTLLMPRTGYDDLLLLPCIVLFTNTFICAVLLLIPFILAALCHEWPELIKKGLLTQAKTEFLDTFLMTLTLSWMALPALEKTGLDRQPFLMCTAMFFIYRIFYSAIRTVKKYAWVRWACFGCGLLLRLRLSPEFFQLMPILKYAYTVIIYNSIFFLLRLMSENSKNINTRLPFAPFLWMGCMLSYTPFLSMLMSLLTRMRR